MASDGRALAGTTPLVVDFDPSASGGGDKAMVDAFRTASQPDGEAGDGAFPIPSSSVAESTKDKAIAVATAPLPGPGSRPWCAFLRTPGRCRPGLMRRGSSPLPCWWSKEPRSSWVGYIASLYNSGVGALQSSSS